MAKGAVLLIVAAAAGIAAALYLGFGSAAVSRLIAASGGNGTPVVAPGFVGTMDYQDWRLVCTRAPAADGIADPFAGSGIDPAGEAAGSACRLSHEAMATGPDRVILAANLSLVGPQQRPALMLRLPAAFNEGDTVALRADSGDVVEAAVYDCSSQECMAASALTDPQWRALTEAGLLQVVFRHPDGQRVYVDLGVAGLQEAVAALRLALGEN